MLYYLNPSPLLYFLCLFPDLHLQRLKAGPVQVSLLPLKTLARFTSLLSRWTDKARIWLWHHCKHLPWGPNTSSLGVQIPEHHPTLSTFPASCASQEQPCSLMAREASSLLCLADCLQAQLLCKAFHTHCSATLMWHLCPMSPPQSHAYDYLLTISSCLPSPKNKPLSSYLGILPPATPAPVQSLASISS